MTRSINHTSLWLILSSYAVLLEINTSLFSVLVAAAISWLSISPKISMLWAGPGLQYCLLFFGTVHINIAHDIWLGRISRRLIFNQANPNHSPKRAQVCSHLAAAATVELEEWQHALEISKRTGARWELGRFVIEKLSTVINVSSNKKIIHQVKEVPENVAITKQGCSLRSPA